MLAVEHERVGKELVEPEKMGGEQGQVFAVRKRRDKDETGNKRITDQAASQTQQVGGLVSLLYSTTSKGSHRKITTTRWFNFAFGHVRTIRE